MNTKSTRRGFTQINRVGQVGPALQLCGAGSDNAPAKGHLAAFTLIELLVVVLIIGILAAVAVPQYKKAVLKSRYSALMPITKAVALGNENYYLSNGEYATQLSKLAVEKPEGDTSGVLVGLQSTEHFDYVLSTRQGMNNNYIIYQKHSPNFADNIHCEAKTDDTQANDLCKSLGGVQTTGNQTEGYTTYILQGNAADGHLPTVYRGDSNITLRAIDKCISTGGYTCDGNTYEGGKCTAGDNACFGGTYRDGGTCTATGGNSCSLGTFYASTCEGKGFGSCKATFKEGSECIGYSHDGGAGNCGNGIYEGSTCTAKGPDACSNGNFTNSECIAEGKNACSNNYGFWRASVFNNSTCVGKNSATCSNSAFTNNSKCVMNHDSACQGNTYQTGAGCQAASGFTCPAGTPQPGGWDATTQTYTPAGWNGGYCDPSAMVGGVCPSGSPTATSGTCWDGNGNEITC